MIMDKSSQYPKNIASPVTIDLLAARSSYRDFGAAEIFVDRIDTQLIEVSPETAAAKLIVDLLLLLPRLAPLTRSQIIRQRHQIVEPIRLLITPLISGETPYLEGTTTPEQMFISMLNWLNKNGHTRRPENNNMCRAGIDGQSFAFDKGVLAVYLTLDVLLDGADLRQALNGSVKLNMPQMFNCLCHLLLRFSVWQEIDNMDILDIAEARRKLLSDCLRQLHDDRVTRMDPDPALPVSHSPGKPLH
ncbi:MAG: hypothetical protein HOE62_16120 [Alphaproteobacteria bacterium]|jgi:hypothetical protein|nr:hypothetical protein [Alphaproteobacteria bacterium]MBT4019480.1 hypothetical protein [Alphaproteobacteria bacterium]MBT4967302.1 hypothetical protein [Alphaproteobacteria bacterium]